MSESLQTKPCVAIASSGRICSASGEFYSNALGGNVCGPCAERLGIAAGEASAAPKAVGERESWRVPFWMEPFESFLEFSRPPFSSERWLDRIQGVVNCKDAEEYGYEFALARARIMGRIRILLDLHKAGLLKHIAHSPRG